MCVCGGVGGRCVCVEGEGGGGYCFFRCGCFCFCFLCNVLCYVLPQSLFFSTFLSSLLPSFLPPSLLSFLPYFCNPLLGFSFRLQDMLAMPTVKGRKSPSERFAGADDTYTIEALMQNGWALQSGTRVHGVLVCCCKCYIIEIKHITYIF